MFGERYPELPHTENMIDHWRDIGFVRQLQGGLAALEWQEIEAYKSAMGCDFSPIEALTLVEMSKAYVSCISDTNPLSIEPMERNND